MFFQKKPKPQSDSNLINSRLYDERDFYQVFTQDLLNSQEEVIIESPYITTERLILLNPIFQTLLKRNVKIFVLTRDPREHTEKLEPQAEQEIINFENMGIHTFICKGNDHRKLAIIDRKILWEGSLNILSQTRSREIMRRIDSHELATQMFDFLKLGKFV